MSAKHLDTGNIGENIAYQYLLKQGFEVVEIGWRSKRLEIDIIANDGNILVFVEVKTRRSLKFGSPFEAVNWKKQNSLDRAANRYISKTKHTGEIRFDIISVYLKRNEEPEINHIRDAFWPEAK